MRLARTLLAMGLVLTMAAGIAGCAQADDEPATTDPTTTQPVSPGNEPQLQATPDAPQVEMRGEEFIPAEVEIEAGGSVTWINSDSVPHTVTGQGGLDSPALQQGQSYTREFTEPGEYWYVCSIHPNMRGRVTVR